MGVSVIRSNFRHLFVSIIKPVHLRSEIKIAHIYDIVFCGVLVIMASLLANSAEEMCMLEPKIHLSLSRIIS